MDLAFPAPRVKRTSGLADGQRSTMATARVHPAEAPLIFTGKQTTEKPLGGRASRLCSFSRWQ